MAIRINVGEEILYLIFKEIIGIKSKHAIIAHIVRTVKSKWRLTPIIESFFIFPSLSMLMAVRIEKEENTAINTNGDDIPVNAHKIEHRIAHSTPNKIDETNLSGETPLFRLAGASNLLFLGIDTEATNNATVEEKTNDASKKS